MPHLNQHDSTVFEFTVLNNGVAADLTNVDRIVANFKRSNGSTISRLLAAQGNVITYAVGAEEVSMPGIGQLNVQLFNEDRRVTSVTITVYVTSVPGAAFEVGKGMPLLQELFVEIGEIQAETQSLHNQLSNLTDYAKVQGDYALGQGDYAKAEGSYAKAEGDYAKAAGDTTKAQGLTAKSQGELARTQGEYAKVQGDYAKAEADRLVGTDVSSLDLRIDDVTVQLAQKANDTDVRKKAVKIELEDLSSNTLGAMSGNATFNLLSIPQNGSVTPEKIEGGAEIYYKNLYKYPTHYIAGKYIDAAGAYVTNASTGYAKVPVLANKSYSYWRGNNAYTSTMNFVDASGAVIQSIDLSGYVNGIYNGYNYVTVQTPSNCAYAEFNVKMSAWDLKESAIFILGDKISAELLANPVIYKLLNATVKDKATSDELDNVKGTVGTLEQTVDNELLNIPKKIGETKNALATPLIAGLYSSSNGAYTSAVTNWYCYNAENLKSDTRDYILENPTTGTVRLLIYTASGYSHNSIINTNERFTVPADCTRFAINIALTNPNPATSLTQFPSTDDFVLSAFDPTYQYSNLLSRVEALETGVDSSKALKILSIGNSFSMDAHAGLHSIADSAGVPILLGNLYVGAATLELHWNNASTNTSAYQYQKYFPGQTGRVDRESTSIDYAVLDEDWDIITFQQASNLSGVYSSYQPYLNNLLSHVKNIVTNPDVKYGIHMTWAYSSTYVRADYTTYYNSDQMTMYLAIVGAVLQAMNETNIDILIPGGTAIQNARDNSYLLAVDDELTSDGQHLGNLGDYIAGMAFFETLAVDRYDIDTFSEVDYIPTGSKKFLTYLAKLAVKNAVLKPLRVSGF